METEIISTEKEIEKCERQEERESERSKSTKNGNKQAEIQFQNERKSKVISEPMGNKSTRIV